MRNNVRDAHTHCQCDFCTGEDCGQDNPEEFVRNAKEEQRQFREEVLEEVYKGLEALSYQDFEGGSKIEVVDWADIESLFLKLRKI